DVGAEQGRAVEDAEAAEDDPERPQLEPVRAARRPRAQPGRVLEQARQEALLERLELLRVAEEAGVRDGDRAPEALAHAAVAAHPRGQGVCVRQALGGED